MQYKLSPAAVAAIVAYAGVANAQSECLSLVTSIPACALGYVASIGYGLGCDIVNFSCLCANFTPLANSLGQALATYSDSCNVFNVLAPAQNLCSCATSYSTESITLESYQSVCEPTAISIPPCALGYIASAGVAEGCQINDFACQCSNFPAIQGDVSAEVSSFCSTVSTGIDAVLTSASALCNCVTGATGGTGPAGPTTTGGSSPTAGTTASPSGGSSSGPVATGGTTAGTTAKASGTTAGTTAKASGSTTAKASGSGSGIPVFSNAGATASVFGGLVGVVAGLAAML